jgi:AcrR family transcriptional regulator
MNIRRARPDSRDSARASSPWKAQRERQLEREIKRDAVIRAAALTFKQKGYHNTSLDDIAAVLTVSKPTVYYYVRNKEELLFECFAVGLQPILAAFRAVKLLDVPARERLARVLRSYGEAVASEFGWCMVGVEEQDLSAGRSRFIRRMKSQIDHGIRELILQGQKDGSIGPCDPKMTAFALAGALNWIAHWYREGMSMNASEIAAHFVDVFEQGLLPRQEASTSARARRSPRSAARRAHLTPPEV